MLNIRVAWLAPGLGLVRLVVAVLRFAGVEAVEQALPSLLDRFGVAAILVVDAMTITHRCRALAIVLSIGVQRFCFARGVDLDF